MKIQLENSNENSNWKWKYKSIQKLERKFMKITRIEKLQKLRNVDEKKRFVRLRDELTIKKLDQKIATPVQ